MQVESHTASVNATLGENATPEIPSNLPINVLCIISEHLAGMNAFGTLASLNVMNHHIHDMTAPVLYGTLLLDGTDRDPLLELVTFRRAAKRRQYTKYITCNTIQRSHLHHDAASLDILQILFPNLVMIIWTRRNDDGEAPHSGGIDLLRPLDAAKIFRIVAAMPAILAGTLELHTLRTINTIWLGPRGCVTGRAKISGPPVFLSVGNPAVVAIESDTYDSEEYTATVFRILEIGGREYKNPANSESWTGQSAPHFEVTLKDQFSLERFVQRWRFMVSARPYILIPRLRIVIRYSIPSEMMQRVLESMNSTYMRYSVIFGLTIIQDATTHDLVRLVVPGSDRGERRYEAVLQVRREGITAKSNVQVEFAEEEVGDGTERRDDLEIS